MCGLAGILTKPGAHHALSGPGLGVMMASLERRGPDDGGYYTDSTVTFGFRRLAIVGGPDAHQPYTSPDKRIISMANGEIYNYRQLRRTIGEHRLHTTSDTEVIPHLFADAGLRAFERLTGMFAAAIWDRSAMILTLVRDRLGIKPLFFHRNRERVIFASEIKALLAYPDCPRRFNWAAGLAHPWINEDLLYSAGTPPTFFEEIEVVPAGGYVQISADTLDVTMGCYWRFPPAPDSGERTPESLVAEYQETLISACHDALACENRPGIMLSGGVDSSVIAAVAAQHQLQADTFTIATRSTLGNGDAKCAPEVALELGLDNHQISIDWADRNITAELWRKITWISESPSCGPEQLYKYLLLRYARALRPDLKVMISGQGSDEFNGGYSRMLACWGRPSWASAQKSIRTIQHQTYQRLLSDRFSAWQREEPLLRTRYLQHFLRPEQRMDDPWLMYTRSKIHDLELFNLWNEDRLTSHFGIEGRVPFLDHRLVEICGRVPAHLRSKLFWDKEILRRAAALYLPSRFLRREKVALFYGPDLIFTERMIAKLLTRNGNELIEMAFPRGSAARSIVDVPALQRCVATVADVPEGVFQLLRLVNMGILDECARSSHPVYEDVPHPCIERINFQSAPSAEPPRGHGQGVPGDPIYCLSPQHALVREANGEKFYLLSRKRVCKTWPESSSWPQVLSLLDGQRTLFQALAATALRFEDIHQDLLAGLEEGYLRPLLSEADEQDYQNTQSS